MRREDIYSALFNKFENIEGLVSKSRKLKHWNEVTPNEQPALFMTQGGELPANRRGMPTTWELYVSLYLYCHAGNDSDALPARDINNYLDKIQDAIKPDIVTGVQELGGLVRDVKIAGKIETDEGLLGSQSIAIIPIVISIEE